MPITSNIFLRNVNAGSTDCRISSLVSDNPGFKYIFHCAPFLHNTVLYHVNTFIGWQSTCFQRQRTIVFYNPLFPSIPCCVILNAIQWAIITMNTVPHICESIILSSPVESILAARHPLSNLSQHAVQHPPLLRTNRPIGSGEWVLSATHARHSANGKLIML